MHNARISCFNAFMERVFIKYRAQSDDWLFIVCDWKYVEIGEPSRFKSGVTLDPFGRTSARVLRTFRGADGDMLSNFETMSLENFWRYIALPVSEVKWLVGLEDYPFGKMMGLYILGDFEEIP